jgi:hypothetical protein
VLQSWLKRILLAGLVFIAVWVLVIVYWRTRMHMPTLTDVVLYLGVAPFALLSSAWLIGKMGSGLVAIGASANTGSDTNTHAKSDANAQSGQMERDWTLNIVFECAITRYGQTINDLVDAIVNKKTGFDLDTELQDANGYPIPSGRIANLQISEKFQHFIQWEAANGQPENQWADVDKRAVVLAYDVFTELSQALLQHPQLSALKTVAAAKRDDTGFPTLYLATIWPQRWTERQQQSVARWFADLIAQQGWPADKCVVQRLDTSTTSDSCAILDSLNVQAHRQGIAGLYLFMSCQSCIGEQVISQPHARGWVPGEAAAGIVLTDSYWTESLAMQTLGTVHRVAQHRLNQAASDSGKINPDLLESAIKDALQLAAIDAGQVVSVSADTDTRANRAIELFEALNAIMPEMDVDADCFRAGAACGEVGTVAGLLALSIAMQRAVDQGGPVLCVGNNDAAQRTALILNAAKSKPE